jgi:hypothetical protein
MFTRGPGSNVNLAAMLSRGDLVNPHVERADALRLRIWPRRSAGNAAFQRGLFGSSTDPRRPVNCWSQKWPIPDVYFPTAAPLSETCELLVAKMSNSERELFGGGTGPRDQ